MIWINWRNGLDLMGKEQIATALHLEKVYNCKKYKMTW